MSYQTARERYDAARDEGDALYTFTPLQRGLGFPVDALPPAVGRFVAEASEAIGCPPDLVACPRWRRWGRP